jgi:hypothetical protein
MIKDIKVLGAAELGKLVKWRGKVKGKIVEMRREKRKGEGYGAGDEEGVSSD